MLGSNVVNELCRLLLLAVDDVSKNESYSTPSQQPSSSGQSAPAPRDSSSRQSITAAGPPGRASGEMSALAEAQEACVLQVGESLLYSLFAASKVYPRCALQRG